MSLDGVVPVSFIVSVSVTAERVAPFVADTEKVEIFCLLDGNTGSSHFKFNGAPR